MKSISSFHLAFPQRWSVCSLATASAEWEGLKWESVMQRVATAREPTPSLLELTFRKLALCQSRPSVTVIQRDLKYITELCTARNAVPAWTPQRMVMMFQSCSLLGYVHPFLLGEMCKEMMKRDAFAEMESIQLVTMIRSIGMLGTVARKTGNLHPCGVFFGISELLTEIMKELTQEERGISFTEVQLCDVWHGLAQLRFYDVICLNPLARETAKPHRLKYYDEAAMVCLLRSAGVLQFRKRHYIHTLLDQTIQFHRLISYTEEELSVLYSILSRLQTDTGPDDTLSAAWRLLDEEVTKPHRLEAFTDQQLSRILSVYPDGQISDHDLQSILRKRLNAHSNKQTV